MKKALITGITGQDGAYLAKFLLEKGYDVYGTYRRLSTPNFWRLQSQNIFNKIKLISADLYDMSSLIEAVNISKPDEIYNLAAQSFVSASFSQPLLSGEINGISVTKILEVIKNISPDTKFYQASTSEMFGNGQRNPLNEKAPFEPKSPYAVAKLYGHWITKIYREGYKLFLCSGILFNHESPLRGLEFVTRKISNSVAQIALGIKNELRLGNMHSMRDWGYAPEYVKSMWLMLQQNEPEDYVIATNETHSVMEFVETAFDVVGLNGEDYVIKDDNFLRPIDVNYLKGDYSKAKKKLGWEPQIKFSELVKIMVKTDLEKWEKWQNGERFPWDAPNYPNETTIIKGPKI